MRVKTNRLLAFVFTSLALLLVVAGIAYDSVNYAVKRSFCDRYAVVLEPEKSEVMLETGKGKLVKVNITNVGFEDEYSISIEGPTWAVSRPEKIRLEEGESGDIYVYMSPGYGVKGLFDVNVIARSFCFTGKETIRAIVGRD